MPPNSDTHTRQQKERERASIYSLQEVRDSSTLAMMSSLGGEMAFLVFACWISPYGFAEMMLVLKVACAFKQWRERRPKPSAAGAQAREQQTQAKAFACVCC